MICFDTNIIIYLAQGRLSETVIQAGPIVYASILKIEALGYHNIRSVEEQRLRELLDTLTEIPLSDAIVARAIQLRQFKKMSLGDAITAATALEQDCTLWTANEADFQHIDGLRLHNPIAA